MPKDPLLTTVLLLLGNLQLAVVKTVSAQHESTEQVQRVAGDAVRL